MTAHMWWWTWVVETWLQVTLGSKSWLRGLKLFFCLNSGHQRLQSKPTFGMWVYNNMKSSLYFCLLNIFGQWLTLHWQTWLSQGSKLDIFVFQLFSVGLQRQLAGSLLVSAPASDTRIIGNFYIPSFNLCLTYMSIYKVIHHNIKITCLLLFWAQQCYVTVFPFTVEWSFSALCFFRYMLQRSDQFGRFSV